jgi:hypothetical protein
LRIGVLNARVPTGNQVRSVKPSVKLQQQILGRKIVTALLGVNIALKLCSA